MPGAPFFLQKEGKLATLVRTAIAPEMKRDFVKITLKTEELANEETHFFRGNGELEHSVAKSGNFEAAGRAADGSLKNQTNRGLKEPKLAATKCSDKNGRVREGGRHRLS